MSEGPLRRHRCARPSPARQGLRRFRHSRSCHRHRPSCPLLYRDRGQSAANLDRGCALIAVSARQYEVDGVALRSAHRELRTCWERASAGILGTACSRRVSLRPRHSYDPRHGDDCSRWSPCPQRKDRPNQVVNGQNVSAPPADHSSLRLRRRRTVIEGGFRCAHRRLKAFDFGFAGDGRHGYVRGLRRQSSAGLSILRVVAFMQHPASPLGSFRRARPARRRP